MEYNPEVNNAGNEDDSQRSEQRINCVKCAYFEITWEPERPRACHMFGFKGKEMPCVTVLKVTGEKCPSFTPKKG